MSNARIVNLARGVLAEIVARQVDSEEMREATLFFCRKYFLTCDSPNGDDFVMNAQHLGFYQWRLSNR
jgi:hypothetical protein